MYMTYKKKKYMKILTNIKTFAYININILLIVYLKIRKISLHKISYIIHKIIVIYPWENKNGGYPR